MSARVFFSIACVWFALAANADGQVAGPGEHFRSEHASSPGSNTEVGAGRQVSVGGPISNAPRSISYASSHAEDALRTSSETPQTSSASAGSGDALSMPLPPRSKRQSRQATTSGGTSSGRALLTVITSLAVVLAVFFAFVWVTRSAAPKGMAPLAKEVVESLGRAPLLGRQQMQLIRIGNKLILLSVTSTGADTLTEITDPVEVDRLSGLCRQSQSGSISDTFRQVLAQASVEPATSTMSNPRQTRRAGSREPHRA